MAGDATSKKHTTVDLCSVRDRCSDVTSLQKDLCDYWRTLTDRDLDPQVASSEFLPLFLRHRYLIRTANLFGKKYHLAIENSPEDACSPGEYGDHLRVLGEMFGEPVALVVAAIPSYARNRMVRMGIPFIVPGSQAFLPPVLIDLRERQPIASKRSTGRKLTPAAQCLVLYHLQRNPLTGIPLQEIANKIGYSPIMLTMVKGELEAAGICESLKEGRTITLRFLHGGKELWQQAEPLLSPPYRKRRWVQWVNPEPQALLAGMTALSRLTMIGDDRVPTYALWQRTFRSLWKEGVFRDCRGSEEADASIESWNYDPLVLSKGGTVDTLSLYLSLRDSPDERVQQQLETLIREFPW